MIGAAIKAKLASDAGITLAVGQRVYAQKKNQPAYTQEGEAERPYITYSVISGGSATTINGTGTTGIQRARVQIRCWSDVYTDVDQLQDLVKALLDGKAFTIAGVNVMYSGMQDFGDDYTAPVDSDEVGTQESSSDFMVCFRSAS